MSNLLHQLGRLIASLFSPGATPSNPDAMRLNDWADLPAHHPLVDRAPC